MSKSPQMEKKFSVEAERNQKFLRPVFLVEETQVSSKTIEARKNI